MNLKVTPKIAINKYKSPSPSTQLVTQRHDVFFSYKKETTSFIQIARVHQIQTQIQHRWKTKTMNLRTNSQKLS